MDAELEKACDRVDAVAQKALAWIADPKNDPVVGQERAAVTRVIRSQAYRARRLKRSLERPMSVGVFGPSQAGKSYLVSVFARKGDTLTAMFDDAKRPEIDFIRDINPYGEKEATGLVTRFSMARPATPPGFPVALRLLTQTDILKILCNSFFFDGDQQEEQTPSFEEIDAHVRGFEAKLAAGPVDALSEEDIWDLEEYFQRQLRRSEAKVFTPFWDRFARAAPRLTPADRAQLFSILWGRHEEFTALYRTLVEALAKLGYAEEAFCPIDSLIPNTTSILNVETLTGLDNPDFEAVAIAGKEGREIALPRPVVAALTAELRIALKERPWPLFDHTDLLDFPGYRGRAQYNLSRYLREGKGAALKELFLRGKVDYLFQRYSAEQELTSMLLCLPPSNLDVTTLAGVIDEWIGVTHGRTPQDRRGRPVMLFFLFTKFDAHLAEKAGDEGADAGLRFQSRLEASLLKPFAKVENSWPRNWADGRPFTNCFWIRNPNYKSEGVIRYDGRREVEILPEKVARIAELRTGCLGVEEVGRHFADPARAFDEVMRLNDGGVSYLAQNLETVCKPGAKQAQVRARLDDLKKRLVERLTPHFVPTDAAQRVAERTAIADAVGPEFDRCFSGQAFGSLLRAFCVDRAGLADAIYESRTRAGVAEANGDRTETVRRLVGIMGRVKAAAGGAAGEVATTASGPSERHARLARAAVGYWTTMIYAAVEDDAFADFVSLSRDSLKIVATELIASARRRQLERELAGAIAASVSHIKEIDRSVAKAAVIAERTINRFVTSFGNPAEPRPCVFDASGIGPEPASFQQDFVVYWLKNFYDEVVANAQSCDGLVHDAAQNALLGQLIAEASA